MIESIEKINIFQNAVPCFKVQLNEKKSDNFIDFLERFFEEKNIEVCTNADKGLDQPFTIFFQGENINAGLIRINFNNAVKGFKLQNLTSNSSLVNRVWSEKKGY